MVGQLLVASWILCCGNHSPRVDSAAITAILRLAYPGSRVVFANYRDTLVDKTGHRDEVELRFVPESMTHVGALLVTFRARRDTAIARAERGVASSEGAPSELLVADLSPTNVATRLRRANLDDAAIGTELNDMKVSLGAGVSVAAARGDTGDVAVVVATYTATYAGRGWVGAVQWRGLLEIKPTSLGAQQRYPEVFVKMTPGDSTHMEGQLRMTEAIPAETSITLEAYIVNAGVVTKKTITLPWSDDRPLSGVLLLSKF